MRRVNQFVVKIFRKCRPILYPYMLVITYFFVACLFYDFTFNPVTSVFKHGIFSFVLDYGIKPVNIYLILALVQIVLGWGLILDYKPGQYLPSNYLDKHGKTEYPIWPHWVATLLYTFFPIVCLFISGTVFL